MKINSAIRQHYDRQRELYDKLAQEVRELVKPLVEEQGWFFLSRVKELPSYALKIETGRFDPVAIEDFFACTVVVPTASHIDNAEQLVLRHYDFHARRPSNDTLTHKAASDFIFDDLRLQIKRRTQVSGRNPEIDGLVFEVQIKTILQHAWSVSTHDLIYKTDSVSWPKERIAFQVKAMLEHAEIAINQAERLADAPAIAKMDIRTEETLSIIDQIRRFWPADALPEDIKRLSQNISALLRVIGQQASQLTNILSAERRRCGLLPRNLSPYAFLVQALANDGSLDLRLRLERKNIRLRILVHREMDLPEWMFARHEKIFVVEEVRPDS